MLIDPEGYDASEQEFAASLEGSRPKFVVKEEPAQAFSKPVGSAIARPTVAGKNASSPAELSERLEPASRRGAELPFENRAEVAEVEAAPAADDNLLPPGDLRSWRNEVTARLDRYRSRRRPREPRYPSLRLNFDADFAGSAEPAAPPRPVAEEARDVHDETPAILRAEPGPAHPAANSNPAGEPPARVIPFRRSANAPPRALEELADPVPLAPRILEVADSPPPQPALGGIMIEEAAEVAAERRPGIEVPLQPAAMSRRLLATAIDSVLVLAALALFGYVFLRIAGEVPPPKLAAAMALSLLAMLWPAYQYTLLVYAGATPGLQLARLRLSRFDGRSVSRPLRRWRVLASALSGISLGLGYFWSILDEDQLCWHDRITETYMAPLA